MDSFFINYDNMKEFNKTSIYRVATEKQFAPPYCIIKKGLNVSFKPNVIFRSKVVLK